MVAEHQLSGQALETLAYFFQSGGILAEKAGIVPGPSQPCHECRLAESRFCFENNVAALLILQEVIHLSQQPFAADESIEIHTVKD